MDLRPTAEQEQLVDGFRRMLEKLVRAETVRAAERAGWDPEVWQALVEVGIVPMGVPVDAGGWGASLLDLALVAEQLGRVLAPAPAIEAIVAARLLARVRRDSAVASRALHDASAGTELVTLALHPGGSDSARLVPAGAIASQVIVRRADSLLLVDPVAGRSPVLNLGAMPVADIPIAADAAVLSEGPDAVAAFESAVDDWLVLTAASLVGVAAKSLEIGVAYAIERKAWGKPIGSYQAVAHPLADAATAVDGARLLAQKAACAHAASPGRASELAAMAFAFASETARQSTAHSLHVHGGYGFMLEYDIQLYFRRARAWSNVFAEPARAYDRVGDRRYPARS